MRVRVGCSCKDLVSVFQGERQNHKTAEGRISDATIVEQAWPVTAVFPCTCILPSNFKLSWTWLVHFSATKICFAHANLFCDLKFLVDDKVVNVCCQDKEILVNLYQRLHWFCSSLPLPHVASLSYPFKARSCGIRYDFSIVGVLRYTSIPYTCVDVKTVNMYYAWYW